MDTLDVDLRQFEPNFPLPPVRSSVDWLISQCSKFQALATVVNNSKYSSRNAGGYQRSFYAFRHSAIVSPNDVIFQALTPHCADDGLVYESILLI